MGCCDDGARAFAMCKSHCPSDTCEATPFLPLESLKVDLRETDDKLIIEAELPGFEHKDISVLLVDTTISISAQKQEDTQENDGYLLKETSSQTAYQRSVLLPFQVDEDQMKAYYDAGILRVDVPKPNKDNYSKQIEIN